MTGYLVIDIWVYDFKVFGVNKLVSELIKN